MGVGRHRVGRKEKSCRLLALSKALGDPRSLRIVTSNMAVQVS